MAKELKRADELRREGLLQEEVIKKTMTLLHRIEDTQLLNRIYRFVQYIYIHKS